ncbi:MAG: T9SS type A sorting domain-containing protein [Dysgonamonadaceae bacterium]|nr:T9SS type A sorting domain-containing protein [Dysgonamonadaceae bacterium]
MTVFSPAGQKLAFYDVEGRETIRLDVPAGLYLVSVASGKAVETFRIILQR